MAPGAGLAIVLLVRTGPATGVFVVGPGMLGHSGADDPSLGYSSLTMDQHVNDTEAAFAPGGAGLLLKPWEEAWYQLNQMPWV